MSLIAKPIVKNQLWVITDGINKVGNIVADENSSGYSVRIGNSVNYFSTTKSIENGVQLVFEGVAQQSPTSPPFALWDTSCPTHNDFYDVKRKIHVFTKTKGSKCYYAAGYFLLKESDKWQLMREPKYILLQRYEYKGPFVSEILALNNA